MNFLFPHCIGRHLHIAAPALFILLFSVSAFAQKATVNGKITDKKSKDALAARISVPSAKTGAVAKADGTYSLSLPAGTHQIIVTFPLYKTVKKTVTVQAGDSQTLDVAMDEDLVGLNEIVVLGTRRSERTVTESPVPIDVIQASEMRQTGVTETNQLLQLSVPSFNFPRPSIADGSDHIRPATMRGLGPDQVLVLVNGKRRHVSSLVNVNGTIGRGSAGVDLNALPANAIERIEVLRDGAAAQYGSDAIAGVINIILRNDNRLTGAVTVGQNMTGFNGGTVDGRVIDLALDYGLALPNAGFVHLSGMFRDRGFSNRSGGDQRAQYTAAQLAADPTRRNPDTANPATFPRKFRLGDAAAQDGGIFLNASLPINENVNLYAFGGYTYRNGESAANFRPPNNANNLPEVYPEGFLPLIGSTINDISFAIGSKGDLGGWTYDLSNTYGQNGFNFSVRNTLNASLGNSTPKNFDAGTLFYRQNSVNLDFAKSFDIGLSAPLSVAFGGEFRLESYRITAGQPESWWSQPNNSGAQGVFPNRQPNSTGGTGIPAGGAQGFPGFQPKDQANTQNADRNNIAVYLDVETKPAEALTVSGAVRFENYSDFGSALTGKVALLLQPIKELGLRASGSTGFRAPSLQQNYFSATATNLIGGQLVEIATFPVSNPAAVALGAQPLKPENSVHFSGGITLEPLENLVLTADYYNIQIRDRILLTGNFTDPAVGALLVSKGINGVSGGRYFTNAADTRTTGLDITARYAINLESAGRIRLTFGMNFTRNEILNDPATKTPEALKNFSATLFDRVERTRLEFGQPSGNANLSINYDLKSLNNFAVMLRFARFGEMRTADINLANDTGAVATRRPPVPVFDQTFSAKILTDLDISVDIVPGVRIAVGANNLFDVYPDPLIVQWQVRNPLVPILPNGTINYVARASTAGSVLPYSGQTPFGFNGRYVYARVAVNF
ncbi:MAG: TonB-dependent receptor [Candidatus Kapabacteria bacterium]|nr:TonB-dependent receptor [Candidatus Kapabacteria bacterium]